jgi:nucleotide-binding universal stress UspA family protein
MPEKVLVPVDGSETMERTVKYACDYAKMKDGTITLLHVVSLPIPMDATEPIDYGSVESILEKAGEDVLKSAQEIAQKQGCKAEKLMVTEYGNPGHAIAKIAGERNFTTIVIHARGHSKVEAFFVGSVCDTVIHRSPVPVIVIRP